MHGAAPKSMRGDAKHLPCNWDDVVHPANMALLCSPRYRHEPRISK
jgi:hypothetical protein